MVTQYKEKTGDETGLKFGLGGIDTAGATKYIGVIHRNGSWYILKIATGIALFARGDSDFPTNWGNRAILSYDYFNNII